MNTVYLTASEHVLPAQPLYAENAGQVGGEVGREHQDVVHEYVVPKREKKKIKWGSANLAISHPFPHSLTDSLNYSLTSPLGCYVTHLYFTHFFAYLFMIHEFFNVYRSSEHFSFCLC